MGTKIYTFGGMAIEERQEIIPAFTMEPNQGESANTHENKEMLPKVQEKYRKFNFKKCFNGPTVLLKVNLLFNIEIY
jgi:hypothetical protein